MFERVNNETNLGVIWLDCGVFTQSRQRTCSKLALEAAPLDFYENMGHHEFGLYFCFRSKSTPSLNVVE